MGMLHVLPHTDETDSRGAPVRGLCSQQHQARNAGHARLSLWPPKEQIVDMH